MEHDDDFKDFGHYLGKVADNRDPRKLGWVRVHVPGLIEPASAWAFPTGGPQSSGGANVGGYDVPPIGAKVMVAFMGGDRDVPFFYGAHHGSGEQNSQGPDAPANADKIKIYESERFLVVLNGISGAEELLFKDKITGDLVSMKPDELQVKASQKVTVLAPAIALGGDEGPAVARMGDAVSTTLSPADLAEIATALLATGAFTPSGSPVSPPPAAVPITGPNAIAAGSSITQAA